MVIVHVPSWDIEVAWDIDGDGQVGDPSYYFTREHCRSSFVYALDEHLREVESKGLLEPTAVLGLVQTAWWYQRWDTDPDGRVFWEYVPVIAETHKSFRVTFILASDLRPHVVELCVPCVANQHDRCDLRFLQPEVWLHEGFSRKAAQHRRWTGEQRVDFLALDRWRLGQR